MSRLVSGLAAAAAVLVMAAPAQADVATEYFKLPPGATRGGTGLAVAPDGTVFFGSDYAGSDGPPLVRLNAGQALAGTADGMTAIFTPDNGAVSGSAIFRDLSYSALDQALYFTRCDNVVGRLVGDTVTTALVPVSPWGIVAAPGGGAWMTEYGAGQQTADPAARAGSPTPGPAAATRRAVAAPPRRRS